ncbi:MAG: hypothetical protein QXW97_01745 [Candidatus Pacearchaeota archaeon]
MKNNKNIFKKNIMKRIIYIIFTSIIFIILLYNLIFAKPVFDPQGTTSFVYEDEIPYFTYNLSANVTNPEGGNVTFLINYINSSLYTTITDKEFFKWISLNSSTGIITINSSLDNETGRYDLSLSVINSSGSGDIAAFTYIINASNDYPYFTDIQPYYNLSQNVTFVQYINASDEENHYPLYFNITFLNNCTKASWWNGTGGCLDLFTFVSVSNNSIKINATPSKNDVGVYYANISVTDFGANYTCISGYCLSNYSENRTYYYPQLLVFNVYSILEINATDCQNRIFQENMSGSCVVNMSTKGVNDNITINSVASVRNYSAYVFNTSWFYPLNNTYAINYTRSVNVSFIPQKTEIGNWSINFTVTDTSFNQSVSEIIYVYVNRTSNDVPRMNPLNNINTSMDLFTRINITVYDDDLLIPDKLHGYNETINFTAVVINLSNMEEVNIPNFSIQIISMPVTGTNRTEAKIEFTPNSSFVGSYFVNITARDKNNEVASRYFNMTIFTNNAPQWITPIETTIIIWENNNTYLNLTENVTDLDNDVLIFSYTNDTIFPSFNLNSSTGVINFIPSDIDVGQHLLTITVSDGFLTSSKIFNFTVYNINDSPYIEKPLLSSDVINASVDSNSNIIAQEDNRTIINLWIQDDDFKIPSNQKSFYNESLTINLTIRGINTSLFYFVLDNNFPTPGNNRSKYQAVFKPSRSDIGFYNISINVTDNSGRSDYLEFNLTILSIEHNPSIMELSNFSTAINRNFYYRINSSDIEDGNTTIPGGNPNFTYSYSFLDGIDFINNNQTIFNITTGELNITFNSSQGGKYRLNITVNDSSGRKDSKTFWIYVYDIPNILYPSSDYSYHLIENFSYNFTFRANHTILDNLTFDVYVQDRYGNNNLNYRGDYFGNNSNYTFVMSISDETISVKNLTLVVYPANTLLENRSSVNYTKVWNLTVNHSNYPLQFINNIGGINKNLSGGSPYQLILSDYFFDKDASDPYHNQTIEFKVNLINATLGTIYYNVTNWTNGTTPMIYFSASSTSKANYTITAYEYNESNISQIISNVTSNIFSLELIVSEGSEATPSQTYSAGGGGGGSTSMTTSTKGKMPYAFKIITPGRISAFAYQTIKIPISLVNTGKDTFKDIELSAYAYKDGDLTKLLRATFDNSYFSVLNSGDVKNLTLTVYFGTNKTGDYEILVNATSSNPVYSDWSKIYINLQKTNETDLKKYLLFTEEFIVQNPACLELTEMLKEANNLYDSGNYGDARAMAEAIINKCKEYVSQTSLPEFTLAKKFGINEIIILFSLFAFGFGILYYFLKRKQIQKAGGLYIK